MTYMKKAIDVGWWNGKYEPISNSARDVNFDEIGEGDLGLNIEWTMEMSYGILGGLEVS